MDTDVRGYIDAHADEFFAALKQWLVIPSISADPARHDDVRRSAQWLAGHLRETGFPVTQGWDTGTAAEPGLPAARAARWVLISGPHDARRVEPLEEWDSPPFEPVERAGQLLARGASDD